MMIIALWKWLRASIHRPKRMCVRCSGLSLYCARVHFYLNGLLTRHLHAHIMSVCAARAPPSVDTMPVVLRN